jgi:hypothetical protein
MDPNLFHLDYNRLVEVLVALIVVSLFVERALSVLFETELFNRILEWNFRLPTGIRIGSNWPPSIQMSFRTIKLINVLGLKSWIAFGLSYVICIYWNLDALTIILNSRPKTDFWGEAFTAGIIAGGSKISSALFLDFLGIMSTAEKKRRGK